MFVKIITFKTQIFICLPYIFCKTLNIGCSSLLDNFQFKGKDSKLLLFFFFNFDLCFFYIHADVVYFYAFSNCLSVWLFKFIFTKNFACYNFTLSAFKLTIFFIWLLKIRAYSIKVRVSKSQYQGHSIKVTVSR